MKKAKKPAKKPASRAAKKVPLTKKKTAPVAKPKKKAPAAKAAPKKAASAAPKKAPPAKKVAAKKAEPKAKKGVLATAKKAVEKAVAKLAPAVVAPPAKGKKAADATAAPKAPKAEKAEKVKKTVQETAPAEVETVQADDTDEEAELYLTDAEGNRYCRVKDCDQIAAVDAYCRYHYLLLWKKIQVRKKILTEGKLERYIEDLTARYPDKYLEMLRKDLRTEKDFSAAIAELEIDDTAVDSEYEDEAQSYLDEVRGHSGEGASERDEEGF